MKKPRNGYLYIAKNINDKKLIKYGVTKDLTLRNKQIYPFRIKSSIYVKNVCFSEKLFCFYLLGLIKDSKLQSKISTEIIDSKTELDDSFLLKIINDFYDLYEVVRLKNHPKKIRHIDHQISEVKL